VPEAVDGQDQQHLGHDRPAKPLGRGDEGFQARPALFLDDAAENELLRGRAHPAIHRHLRGDEQRQRDEEAHVGLDVVEERDRDTRERGAGQRREGQERNPGQRDREDDRCPVDPERIA
jgi:hypothetical protein